MNSAVEVAEKLGIRPSWKIHALPEKECLVREMPSYPSIRFGKYRNNRISITTPNTLYCDPRTKELRTIDEKDLEWYESHSKTPLPDADFPYHQMAFTKIILELSDAEMTIADFLQGRVDLQVGLHRDVRTMIMRNKLKIYVLDHDAPPSNGRRFYKDFLLEPLTRLWRTNYVSSKVPEFTPNGQIRRLYGGIGSPQKLTGLFFGQMAPNGQAGGWICFIRIETFEQLYLTWLDDMTGPVFRRFIEHCGLRIHQP
ncbi:MAG: hypothetical protein P1P90_00010 [Patescibacteria group bacterium]|nr:hypothetical protein [Patescibacteria group bacterium]